MTPKEKAKELVDRFSTVGLQQRNEGIACAEIAVDEILNIDFGVPVIYQIIDKENIEGNITVLSDYWKEVKKEIEAL